MTQPNPADRAIPQRGAVPQAAPPFARENGIWRHGLRYLRHRPDLTPHDLPDL